MGSTSAQDSTYQYPLGFDTPFSNTLSHPESKDCVRSEPSPWHTPPPDALGRPYSFHHDSYERPPTTSITTSFGGILDSPVVQLKPRSANIPLSPPPSLPTTQLNLPVLNDTHNPTLDEPSKIEDNDGQPGVERPRLEGLPTGSFESYSPPLSPVGTSPSFTSLALSFAPIVHRGDGSLVSSASSTTPTSHDGAIVTPSPDPRVLLSPLSPEWDTDFVDEDENDAPLSIDAVLSGVGTGRKAKGTGGNGVGELDDLGLANDEDGRDTFAFAGFLTRGPSRPRLSMLEIPPSAYPAATLSPSSYFPSATSPTVSSLWTLDATPTSPASSSSTLWAGGRESDGGDELKHTVNQTVGDPPFALASSSPHVGTIDLFPSTYDDFDESFNAYDSPQFQSTALPGLLSSPHVSLGDLPEDEYGEPTLLLSSDDRHSLGQELASPVHRSFGLDLDTCHIVHSTCNDREEANLVALLEKYQAAEQTARKQEDEALEAIAAIRSPGSKSTRLSPRLEKNCVSEAPDGSSPAPLSSMSISELQKIAGDARRAAKKARTRVKEVSALLRLKTVEQPESSLFPVSPIDPLLESPSPPMLFEPLDDTTATSSRTRPTISPPLPSFQMDGFAISPPLFGSSNKSMSRKKKGGSVDHLVAKMIFNRREAGCTSTSSSSAGTANGANVKAVFLSPLLGHHHQLQLQQRYKFLRSSPLARSVVTLASPYTSSLPTMPTSPMVPMHYDGDASSNGPSRSNSLDSTCSTDTACSSSSSGWSDWDSDGETSLGEDDIDGFRGLRKHDGLLGSLDDEDEDADEDVEMGFQALKTPLMWGTDLGFDSGFEERSGDEDVESGEDGLLPAL